jgi:thiamine biosynthesis lipoprotein
MPTTNRWAVRLAALALLLAVGCREGHPVQGEFAYGSITGTVVLTARDAPQIGAVLDTARSTALRLLRALDAQEAKSDISRLNKIAATSRWPVPQDTHRALELALHYGQLTDGAFDITTGPIAGMWGLPAGPPPREVPLPEILAVARESAGLDQVRLTDDGTIAFLSPMARLDLGEMAPAYALDLSLVNIRRRSITNTLVRLSSSVRAMGALEKGVPFQETLWHPDRAGQKLGQWVFRQAGALSSCRLYANSVTIVGQRFGGILDPRTGAPVSNTLGAVVSGPTATTASALAQALVVLGVEGSTNILARFPRYEALIVPVREPLEIWVTEGFRRQFEPDPAVANALRTLVPAPLPTDAPEDQPTDASIEAAPANSF